MRWRHQEPERWHRWFAWYPVVIDGEWVWLESVERLQGEGFCGEFTRYRHS